MSTWKNKEQYLRSKDKAEKWYDVSRIDTMTSSLHDIDIWPDTRPLPWSFNMNWEKAASLRLVKNETDLNHWRTAHTFWPRPLHKTKGLTFDFQGQCLKLIWVISLGLIDINHAASLWHLTSPTKWIFIVVVFLRNDCHFFECNTMCSRWCLLVENRNYLTGRHMVAEGPEMTYISFNSPRACSHLHIIWESVSLQSTYHMGVQKLSNSYFIYMGVPWSVTNGVSHGESQGIQVYWQYMGVPWLQITDILHRSNLPSHQLYIICESLCPVHTVTGSPCQNSWKSNLHIEWSSRRSSSSVYCSLAQEGASSQWEITVYQAVSRIYQQLFLHWRRSAWRVRRLNVYRKEENEDIGNRRCVKTVKATEQQLVMLQVATWGYATWNIIGIISMLLVIRNKSVSTFFLRKHCMPSHKISWLFGQFQISWPISIFFFTFSWLFQKSFFLTFSWPVAILSCCHWVQGKLSKMATTYKTWYSINITFPNIFVIAQYITSCLIWDHI